MAFLTTASSVVSRWRSRSGRVAGAARCGRRPRRCCRSSRAGPRPIRCSPDADRSAAAGEGARSRAASARTRDTADRRTRRRAAAGDDGGRTTDGARGDDDGKDRPGRACRRRSSCRPRGAAGATGGISCRASGAR